MRAVALCPLFAANLSLLYETGKCLHFLSVCDSTENVLNDAKMPKWFVAVSPLRMVRFTSNADRSLPIPGAGACVCCVVHCRCAITAVTHRQCHVDFRCRYLYSYGWLRGSVIERWSLTGELSLSTNTVLRSTCVGKPSAVGQPTRPTQPFILSG